MKSEKKEKSTLTPAQVERSKQLCCMEVVAEEKYREKDGLVCQSKAYTAPIANGLDEEQYAAWSPRLTLNGSPAPLTFADCGPKQKRVVLYALLNKQLLGAGGYKKGIAEEVTRGMKWKPQPACLQQAVRDTWPGDS